MGGAAQGRSLPIYLVFVLPSKAGLKGQQVGGWWGAGVWLLSRLFTDNVAALEPALCSLGLSFLTCQAEGGLCHLKHLLQSAPHL